ncbi:MAG: hypothetical protein NC084_12045 [Bacteroides sp.]|nr:hypothetical protein [Eubacterium sp.]MCM1419288.1 hypothetical protein [Roseburia sp.]MCM1463424.1 hypothetical protein [Bacteroides sp.]
MTKRELIDAMAAAIIKQNEDILNDKTMRPIDYNRRSDVVFEEFKDLAKKSGYVGGCFDQLWDKAVTIAERAG